MAELIRPGDRLLIVAPPLKPDDREMLNETMRELFPNITFALIDGPSGAAGLRIVGHYRPGACACLDATVSGGTRWIDPACPLHGDQR